MTPYVSLRISSSNGVSYLTSEGLFFLFVKSSTIPLFNGPGLYSAIRGMMSSNLDGFSFVSNSLIPLLSSWNTPDVSPEERSSYVFASSSGMLLISTSIPSDFNNLCTLSISVSVSRPRKSIFIKPIFSMVFMGYWVTVSPFWPLYKGRCSVRCLFEITMPAAWVDACRERPSSTMALSKSSLIFASFL
ncbi:MAG: hypothetical protein BWX58_01100 [Deltaproteobacteria bacterium ADurb.Bin026]|nr:MAG: hypothetical protein BWX58_01100 [Deltaproteobacteria bacterium ADurb.Bin026]